MINTIIKAEERANQKNWIRALQETAITKTNQIRTDLQEINNTEIKISTLEEKNIEREVKGKNSEIFNKEIEIRHNWEKVNNLKTLWEVVSSDKKVEEKIQIIVESIHWMNSRVDFKNKENTPFYCGDRALLLYQIFKDNKDMLSIKEHSIALPYWHVMNIIKIEDKTYIADAWAWCFNEITDNFEVQKKWEWEVIKLKEPIKLYKNSNKFYWFTSFPTTKNLWNNEFLYTSINIQMFEYYVTNKLYEIARSTKWYENTESIEDLEKFLKEVLYQKENPYEGILEDWDVLLTFSKDQQIKMIEWQIYHRLSYQENKNTLNDLENISKKISEDNPDYETKDRENFLEEFYEDDKNITKALNISDEEKGRILQILIDKKKGNTKEIINELINFDWENEEPLLWKGNKELEIKLINFLKALNLRANQANSSLENELENIFKNI